MAMPIEITYPILNTLTLQPDPTGHRYKVTQYDNGNVSQEYWSDYIASLTVDQSVVSVSSTVTITAAMTEYDGSQLGTNLPVPAACEFYFDGNSQVASIVNSQAVLSYSPTTVGIHTIDCNNTNNQFKCDGVSVTAQ